MDCENFPYILPNCMNQLFSRCSDERKMFEKQMLWHNFGGHLYIDEHTIYVSHLAKRISFFFRFEMKCTSISFCLHLLHLMRCSLHFVRFIHYYYVKINFLTQSHSQLLPRFKFKSFPDRKRFSFSMQINFHLL